MKGFYRAVKRGESWAVEIDILPPFQRAFVLSCARHIEALLSGLISKRDSLFRAVNGGAWNPVTIMDLDFGKKEE